MVRKLANTVVCQAKMVGQTKTFLGRGVAEGVATILTRPYFSVVIL